MYTIGEFSRLTRVSARMLRHYDQLGLLRPARVGADNGYRYYEAAQLRDLLAIRKLQGFGFSLAQIPDLLQLSPQELAGRVRARYAQALAELRELQHSLRLMEACIRNAEGTNMSQSDSKVIVMETPAQRVLSLRRKISIGEVHQLFADLHRQAAEKGLRRCGVTQLLFHGEEFRYDEMDAEAQVEVLGEAEGVSLRPAMCCVAATYTGPYEGIHTAYDAVCSYLAAHPEWRVCGPSVERYIRDEGMVSDPAELVSAVLFPVERAE